ncbi:hypothetical protein [Roseicyclus persicicus]|uniref:Uncharacterized protein n=1 Tax=Roseicyclus persicicus TaxID=2650661 RepID=A0A7X6GX80_9RHOB|nr:hypothetical protein [Roseibacterium persicicum]NKX44076.1 hypothetical protein [Roseibacterium persicicum]
MTRALWSVLHAVGAALFLILIAARIAQAGSPPSTADLAIGAFAETCTVRGLTAAEAEDRMRAYVAAQGGAGLPFALDFYDITLEPTDRPVTPGTDRRCEVAFPGNHTRPATEALVALMERPPVFGQAIPLPITHSPVSGTAFIEGRQLNPRVAAVVHVGTRRTEAGLETFLNVERLRPSQTDQN